MNGFRRIAWALLVAGLLAGCEMSINMTDDDNNSSENEPSEPTGGTNIVIFATHSDTAFVTE